jgi:hypothetical protein
MPDLGTRLKRELESIEVRPFTMDDFHVRRGRERQHQRLAASVVGIAVFVVAMWIVRDIGSLDRTRTDVPGGSGAIGPTVTGPVVAVPTYTEPVHARAGDPEGHRRRRVLHARLGRRRR